MIDEANQEAYVVAGSNEKAKRLLRGSYYNYLTAITTWRTSQELEIKAMKKAKSGKTARRK